MIKINDVVVSLEKISKKYEIKHKKKSPEYFEALKNINLEIKRGEKIGIIGQNGAGKSTLLKIIAGIVIPSSGKIETKGKIIILSELESGFHKDLSGLENILLNGLLIGMSRKEVESKISKIVKFADIGDFINQPLYTFSQGMKFRLAFAIGVFSKCDILIIDEVFVLGDLDFQKKTFNKIIEIQRKKYLTTIFCSHVLNLIWRFADKFYLLKNGKIEKINKNEMQRQYKKNNLLWKQNFGY